MLTVVSLLGVTLGGCNDLYYARRDTMSLVSGESMAANRATHTIDPWSPASGRRDIAYNGEKAQTASERYRTGRVIRPMNATTSSAGYSPAQQAAQPASNSQASTAPGGSSIK
jgi:hypothetical protein